MSMRQNTPPSTSLVATMSTTSMVAGATTGSIALCDPSILADTSEASEISRFCWSFFFLKKDSNFYIIGCRQNLPDFLEMVDVRIRVDTVDSCCKLCEGGWPRCSWRLLWGQPVPGCPPVIPYLADWWFSSPFAFHTMIFHSPFSCCAFVSAGTQLMMTQAALVLEHEEGHRLPQLQPKAGQCHGPWPQASSSELPLCGLFDCPGPSCWPVYHLQN